jgi:protoporphyrin/coproporphyrin ferrochelatase
MKQTDTSRRTRDVRKAGSWNIRPERLAVVLFNLGGPDSLEAVEPFLKNLFLDPAILPVPGPLRALVARRITKKRAPTTRDIYRQLGGKTPLLEMTGAQGLALENSLKFADFCVESKVFVAMRYWHPRAKTVVQEVKAWKPTEVVLLPLYPQHSSTTSGTSIKEWKEEAVAAKLIVNTRTICCYPEDADFISAHVKNLKDALGKITDGTAPRVLFSAHGLPKSIVEKGDPYQKQIEKTVASVVQELGVETLDYSICYQSRVTKQEWIGPSTDEEILRAATDGVPVVLTPIAFVSEHSETLIELDVEYKKLAEESGVPQYIRVPALGISEEFVQSLSQSVIKITQNTGIFSVSNPDGTRLCEKEFSRCPCRIEADERGELSHG